MSDILESALRITSFGPQFKSVLKTKLKLKGFHEDEINQVIDKLESLEIIDDFKVSKLYITSQVKNKLWGPGLIRGKLFEKGVEKDIIEQLINEVFFDSDEEIDICQKCLTKFVTEKEKLDTSKVYRKLQSKGFSARVIKYCIKNLSNSEIDDDI